MKKVEVLGYSEVSNRVCLKVIDGHGSLFYGYDFHCEFKRVAIDDGKLYYMLMCEYVCGSYFGCTLLGGSYDPNEVLNECDRLRSLIGEFYDKAVIPQ